MTDTDRPAPTPAPTADAPSVHAPRPNVGVDPVSCNDELRVSTIVGDRLCVRCGFNLTGQPVMKESKYNLFIARCPECGTVAALQEYPVLGKWASRWAALAAALWLLVLMAGAFGLASSFFGLSMAGSQLSGNSASAAIVAEWVKTEKGHAILEQVRATSRMPSATLGRWAIIDADWWAAQDQWEIIAKHGGIRRLTLSPMASILTAAIVIGFIGGVFGSVGLLHARRLRLVFLLLLPIAIAAVFQLIAYQQNTIFMGWSSNASDIATHLVMPMVFALTDIIAFAGLIVGALLGRPIARGLVRAYLPPKMRSTMSFLWLAAGKTPPKP